MGRRGWRIGQAADRRPPRWSNLDLRYRNRRGASGRDGIGRIRRDPPHKRDLRYRIGRPYRSAAQWIGVRAAPQWAIARPDTPFVWHRSRGAASARPVGWIDRTEGIGTVLHQMSFRAGPPELRRRRLSMLQVSRHTHHSRFPTTSWVFLPLCRHSVPRQWHQTEVHCYRYERGGGCVSRICITKSSWS